MAKNGTNILGIDVGYAYTKVTGDNGNDSFRSTVRDGVIDVNANSTVIEYEGKMYTIGEQGRITIAQNKIQDPNFEKLLLTGIIRNVPDSQTTVNTKIVTGLPIGWYQNQKDALRDFLLNKKITIGYNGKEKKIHIEDCLVFPQSAGLVLTNPQEFAEGKTNLIIDIGGLTIDVAYYDGRKIVHLESYELGMLKFYSYVSSAINSQFNIRVSDIDVERFIDEDAVTINEEPVPFDFDSLFKNWMDEIVTQLKKDFPYDIVQKKSWIGGGSLRFEKYLPSKRSINCDKMFNNSEAFRNVGVQKFG